MCVFGTSQCRIGVNWVERMVDYIGQGPGTKDQGLGLDIPTLPVRILNLRVPKFS